MTKITKEIAITNAEICNNYIDTLRLLYGDEIANKSNIYYIRGWFYINLAQRFDDGSVGSIGPATAHRKKQVIEYTNELQRRANRKK